MKKSVIWKILLFLGICFFAAPLISGVYKMSIESWALVDWIVMYSFIYWPTYVIGLLLVVFAAYKLMK